MPARVGVRELRQNLSVHLRRVRAGERLEVTERGRPVAALVPIDRPGSALDRLVAAGRASRPEGDPLARAGAAAWAGLTAGRLRPRRSPSGRGVVTVLLYSDSSALVKLVVPEPESGALWDGLAQWPERVSSALARVELLREVHRARAVLADLRRDGAATWEKFSGGRQGTLWYYRALADLFGAAAPGFLADELERVVAEIERLAA